MDIIKLITSGEIANDFSMEHISDVDELQMNLVRVKAGKDLPAHNANSNVRLIVLEGDITVTINGEDAKVGEHEVASVEYNTPMQIRNLSDVDAAFLVIKTPNPRMMA